MLSLLLCAALQAPRLDLSTDLPAVGQAFGLCAIEGGRPVPGAVVDVLASDGQVLAALRTGEDGRAQWSAAVAGPFTLRWLAPSGVELLVPLHAVASRPWWWMAIFCVPLGLWLARAAWRR